MTKPKRAQAVELFRELKGTRWRHQGTKPEGGLDCVQAPLWILLQLGWQPKDERILNWRNYPREAEDDTLLELLRGEGEEIEIGAAREADFLVQQCEGCVFPQHLLMVTQNEHGIPWAIHSSAERRQVIEHRVDAQLRRQIIAAFELTGFWAD